LGYVKKPEARTSDQEKGRAIEMRRLIRRIVPFLAVLTAATGMLGRQASAEDRPLGNWSGVIVQSQQNIPIRLTVTNLQIGAPGGTMRWGTPRTCSVQTEYSGMRDAQYSFNIAASNGGWCDLYRGGTLLLHLEGASEPFVAFTIADRQGGRIEEGKLAASSPKAQKMSNAALKKGIAASRPLKLE
jgi:hypothetical protein